MAERRSQSAFGKDGPGAAAFRVQNQIRRNAEDMQEYLADLGSWEKSIKKKDKQLSRKATAASNSSNNGPPTPGADTPPIRPAGSTVPIGSGPPPRTTQSTETISATGKAPGYRKGAMEDSGKTKFSMSAAGHTHDKGYGKWAKFDIDAALRSVDEEEEGVNDKQRCAGTHNSSDSDTDSDVIQATSGLTPATMVDRSASQGFRRPPPSSLTGPPAATIQSNQPPRDLEKEERERGNAKFGQGDFEGAVKSYTRCVGMNSKSSLAFSNRAMAYLKLREFGKAESDADAALRVDPRHVKSLQRRAVARNAVGKHRAALADLQTAAEIDPSSKQIRKDLSRTLETLKTVVRRAPKRHVVVESAPFPAPKPRGYHQQSTSGEEGVPPALPTNLEPAFNNASSAVSAINRRAPVTEDEETAAPYSSVLQESTDNPANVETNLHSYQARTIVEELPGEEEATLGTPLSSPTAPTNAVSSGKPVPLPSASIKAAAREERRVDPVPSSRESAECSAATAILSAKAFTVRAVVCETTKTEATTSSSGAADVATTDLIRPAVSTVDVSIKDVSGLSLNVGAKKATKTESGSRENSSLHHGAHPVDGEAGCLSLQGKTEDKEVPAPIPKPEQVGTAQAPNATAQAVQLPTTGYQFEHMWRSACGSPEARLDLLRTVPPSSVAKFFRRTPIEVDLLGSILRDLGEAFLPRRPATALRWLKSLAKASRFGMTVALLGEEGGRAAARELLRRLEEAPPTRVNAQDVDALRKQFLC